MASYEELQKLSAWLKISEASVGRTVLMPMTTSDVKAPMFKHAGKAQWGWAEADAYANSNPTHTPWGMLLDGLVVVDADDAETVEWLEMMKYEEGEVGEAMQRCAIQETRKGRHYMFLRPQWADEEGYYDGARQVKHKEVDMKTLCRTGTRSLLSVAPTEGKAWVKGRAPWELESMMIPYIPKALMERVAKKIRTAGASKANVATKTEVGSESSRLQGQGTVVMIPNSFMDSPPVEKLLLLLSKSRWDSRETWRGVATALKNEYGETYKVLWKKMSKVSSRYDEEAAEKLWETVGRPHYDGPKLTMKTVVKWACEDDPHGYAAYRAASIPKLIKDRWEKGDYGLGQIVHFLLQGTVKKTGGGHKDYYIFEEDTCRWAKVDDGFVNTVAMNVLEGVMRDIDLWISTQTAQLFCIGVGEEDDEEEDSMSKSGMDVKKKKVATLTNYVMSYRGVKNVMAIAGPLLMDETFEQRLDSNRHLIGIKGGSVVDLRTGKKRQRVAEDMVHNELDVAYDGGVMTAAAATNAEWMHRIVQKIMGGDEAMARFLQILLGYGITGEVREEVFPVWTGSGRNGKGLLTQALQQLLGAYYKEMNCAIISDSRVCSNIDAERAKLIGARLAVFNELKNGEKLKTNEVQLLTGGDGFPAKALYKDPVTVMPRHLNMRCFVDTAGNCIVKCFSATCDNHAPACIGRLAEPGGDSWDAGALHVNSRYIDIDACLEMKQAVDVWLDPERRDVNTLSVRSPMGNVVVVSLSQERAMQVHKVALDTFDDPKDAARLCLLHTSKTADSVKAKLIDVDALWSSKRIVVYTPTISAGIDFSTEHFDRMYLYLCPGSTGPMGALQMTGRVRHLVDTDVRTLVAKNMRVAREATRQHLTHVDLYQWLRWMDGFSTCDDVKHVQAIDGGEEHTLQELSGGALAPLCATVAPPTLKMTVESYFLAEIHNASFDYLSCFADLVEPAGHRVDLGTSYAAVSAARVIAPGEGDVEATSEFLLRVLKAQEQMDALTGSAPVAVPATGTVAAPVAVPATGTVAVPATGTVAVPATGTVAVPGTNILSNPDVPTAMRRKDLMDAIEQRVMANDASEDDKFIMYPNRYCSAWGVDRVDEEFLMENKPGSVGSPKARLMSRLLCPILRPVRGADVHTTEHSGLLKIVLIEETLAALGFSSPFDTETVIPNLMTVFDTKLKGTQMFREYNNTARLFSQASCGVRDGWDLCKVSKAVKMILSAVGLDMMNETKRVQYHKMKRALLVSPIYALNLEARLTRVLEEAALLPSDLRTYSTTGFATDVERFKESLGEGFSCNVMGGTSEVPKRDLRAAIQHLLQPGTDVAVLLFCGHGTWSGSTQHGALVCSFGQQITAQDIEDIVAQQGFTGTFVRVLNMCEEGSTQHASSSVAEASIPYSIADYNGVIIAASTMFGMARGGEGGSEFMDAWVAVGQLPTYHKLGTVLKEHCPNVRVTMQNMNSKDGVFDDAMRIPGIIKDNWDKGDYGLGQIAHFLLQGSVKKTGKGCSDYFIFEEDTCRWAKVDEGRVKSVVVEAMEEALRDVDLWIATQSAQRRLQGGDAKMRVANLDLKKREVKVWQLAGPVLVAHASIEEELVGKSPEAKDAVRSRTWWKVLETTRHLLAHPSITDTDDILKIVLVNLRALLYAARVDITTHRKWKFLDYETTVSFKEPGGTGEKKTIWVDKIITVLLSSLNNCTVSELRNDFDNTTVDVAAFINKNDELQAENVALVAHSNAVTLHVAELTSYSNAVVPIVNELQAQNAELTSYSNAVVPLVNELQAQNADLTSYSNAVVPLVNELQAQNAELTSYYNAIAPLINQVQARSGCQG
eukprot:gene24379-biopygen18847